MMEVDNSNFRDRHVSKEYVCTSGIPDKLYLIAGDDKEIVVRTTHEGSDGKKVVTVLLPPTEARALALDLLQSADLADKYRKDHDD